MLEHRPLHQDVKMPRQGKSLGHLPWTCWSIGPCIRMSSAIAKAGEEHRPSILHVLEQMPQAQRPAPCLRAQPARQLLFTAMTTRRMLPKLRPAVGPRPAVVGLRPARPTLRLQPVMVPLLAGAP